MTDTISIGASIGRTGFSASTGVDQAAALSPLQEGVDVRLSTLYDATSDGNHVLVRILLDDLCDQDAIPRSQWGTSLLSVRNRLSEHVSDGADVRRTTIDAERDGSGIG